MTLSATLARPSFVWNQAITIHAPPAEIWPWLVQIGNQRAGWYSWDGLHRLMGMPGYAVVAIEPDRALVTHIDDENGASWVWVLEPIDGGTTRLIARFRQTWQPGLASTLGFGIADEMGSLAMQPKTLSGIKKRAEAAAGR